MVFFILIIYHLNSNYMLSLLLIITISLMETMEKRNIVVSTTTLTSQIKAMPQMLSLIPEKTNYHLFPQITHKYMPNICAWSTIDRIMCSSISRYLASYLGTKSFRLPCFLRFRSKKYLL